MASTELSPRPATGTVPLRDAGGLGGLLGTLDAALADAELLERLRTAAEGPPDRRVAGSIELLLELQGWTAGSWWRLDRGRLRLRASVGPLGPRPVPRAGVGPLGRSQVLGVDVVAACAADADCPRLRRAHALGARRAVVLCGAADGREGRLELLGDPPGGLGPERLALLRHLAWVLVLVDDG